LRGDAFVNTTNGSVGTCLNDNGFTFTRGHGSSLQEVDEYTSDPFSV
jgi:hypothetical protein